MSTKVDVYLKKFKKIYGALNIMGYENGQSSSKNYNWELIGYPDAGSLFAGTGDLVDFWFDTLSKECKDFYISPLHDKDRFERDEEIKEGDVTYCHKKGELKEAHWHVVACFDRQKSREAVKEWAQRLGFRRVKSVMSLSGMLRYLCHLDGGKGKELYNVKDVRCLNDNYLSQLNVLSDKDLITKEIITTIKADGISSFSDLVLKALDNGKDWLSEIRNHAFFYRSICLSVGFAYRQSKSKYSVAAQMAERELALEAQQDDIPF